MGMPTGYANILQDVHMQGYFKEISLQTLAFICALFFNCLKTYLYSHELFHFAKRQALHLRQILLKFIFLYPVVFGVYKFLELKTYYD